MLKKIFFAGFLLTALSVSCSKDKDRNIYPDADNSSQKPDADENIVLPDNNENPDADTETVDKEAPDTQKTDLENNENDQEKNDPDIISDTEINDEDADIELIDLCLEKECLTHEDCSIEKGACRGFSQNEKYACFPDVTDFGYQGGGTCVEVNCSEDSECRENLGYMCIDFGFAVPEFDEAKTGCLMSVIGEECSDEGKKICQFGREIALECKDGKWEPEYCENGDICEAGECIEPTSDNDELNDEDTVLPVEICDNKDNTGEGNIDEGCDSDGDGWCDINMIVVGNPDVCQYGGQDCNDNDAKIYPGSKNHTEGVDYDCDNRKEYQAVMVLSVDDELVELCANGKQFNKSEFGLYYQQWPYADTYSGEKLVLESGINVIGIHGKDTGLAISAFVGTISVNGQVFISDGVLPPLSGNAYTPSDPQWTQAQWRYFPEAVPTPNADWCDKWFDDSDWGPAIKAGKKDTAPEVWGNLGTNPWYGEACGLAQSGRCPTAFESYYIDATIGNEPKWIWDYNPTQLADAWLRIKIVLP